MFTEIYCYTKIGLSGKLRSSSGRRKEHVVPLGFPPGHVEQPFYVVAVLFRIYGPQSLQFRGNL